jgi:hypothetical protein
MPIIFALLAAAGIAIIWFNRAKNAAHVATEVADIAQTALGAARRFGFRRQANRHPVDSIDDPNLAIGGLATAFFELSGLPTAEEKQALHIGLQSELGLSLADAEEMVILGHWFVNECGGALPAVSRLAKRMNRLSGPEGLTRAMAVIDRIAKAAGGDLGRAQREALDEIKSVFRLR